MDENTKKGKKKKTDIDNGNMAAAGKMTVESSQTR